jgi:hypothetical protein
MATVTEESYQLLSAYGRSNHASRIARTDGTRT